MARTPGGGWYEHRGGLCWFVPITGRKRRTRHHGFKSCRRPGEVAFEAYTKALGGSIRE
jgi:hypothetical protein